MNFDRTRRDTSETDEGDRRAEEAIWLPEAACNVKERGTGNQS
jgi:hypothetical protein